jgi:hypothetical protein
LVFVLGAGVDLIYGVPLVAQLLPELAKFARSDGLPVSKALKAKLPNLRFSFDKYAAKKGDQLLVDLFGSASDTVPTLQSAAKKLMAEEELKPIATVLEKLCQQAEANLLAGSDLSGLAKIAESIGDVGEAEPLLDPSKITLTEPAATALRRSFQRVLIGGPDLTEHEREMLGLFVESTSNIEELLSHYFTLYSLGDRAAQRNYLYIAWMLWSFLWLRSRSTSLRSNSIYAKLALLGGDVITFNYTDFFDPQTAKRVVYFHGSLAGYLRADDRQLVTDDQQQRKALDVEGVVAFLHSLRLDVGQGGALDLPAIVPPISFKPVMSRRQILDWASADKVLQSASHIVVVGYSFGLADEHFNDLLRSTPATSRVLVVNPNCEAVTERVCDIFGIDSSTLSTGSVDEFPVLSSRRLSCLGATAEDVTPELLEAVLR